jgi:hypothetical protein
MTRDQLEAGVWAITGRQITGTTVDAICDLAEAYAAERHAAQTPRRALHHADSTDLYPIIGALADLLNSRGHAEDELAPRRRQRGAA